MFNLENGSRGGIESVDSVSQQMNRNIGQLIMQYITGDSNILFITVV